MILTEGGRVLPPSYPWQDEALARLSGGSGVLSAPTGSGKTRVAYCWAGLVDGEGRVTPPAEGKVIFTAPIKALSNERYLELGEMGLDVGIETGDFKKNPEAPVLCCTQEIYNLKYAGLPGLRVVIDEFHYIFDDNERARAYIDGISRTHPDVPILVMSATFGETEKVKDYLQRTANRPFTLVTSTWRASELTYRPEGITPREIKDALVFTFSQRGTGQIADLIADERRDFDRMRAARLRDLAWILQVPKIRRSMFKGVGVYHGSLLPKEKLLVERAYRERILDVVVGTDALALGVNLPAETVVFAQLVKYHDRQPLRKSSFTQMAGRAGRKGLFDRGYVTYLHDSPAESRGVDTGQIFSSLLTMPIESARVLLKPDYSALLKGETTVSREAEHIAKGSLPQVSVADARAAIQLTLEQIAEEALERSPNAPEQFKALLADLWYGEMNLEQNLAMTELYIHGATPGEGYTHPNALLAAEALKPWERNDLQALLRVKRFNNSLPEQYKLTGMKALDQAVMDIDPTVYGFEDKIDEMNATQPELPESVHRLQKEGEKRRFLKRKGQRKKRGQERAKAETDSKTPPSKGKRRPRRPRRREKRAKNQKS